MFLQQLLLALKSIPHGKYEKNLLIMLVSFFTTLDLAWPKFCPKTRPILVFSPGSQWNMLGDSISFNKFNWNLVFLKKKGKTSKSLHFWTQLAQKRGQYGPSQKGKNSSFYRNNKRRSEAFKKLLLYQNIICIDEVLFCVGVFLLKSVISARNGCAHLRTKWLWVWIPLPLLKESSDN